MFINTTFSLSTHQLKTLGLLPPFDYCERCFSDYSLAYTLNTSFQFLVSICTGVELRVIQHFYSDLFEEPPSCFPWWLDHLYFQQQFMRDKILLYLHKYFFFFMYSYPNWCDVVSHYCLDLYFLMINDVDNIFVCLLVICVSFFFFNFREDIY